MNNMIRRILRREDGVTIVMVLAFMALAVPVVTAALGLASTLSIDSRIKGEIAQDQFSALGASGLATERLTNDDLPGPDGNGIPDILEEDNNGFDDGDGTPDIYEDTDYDGEPDGYQETVDINGEPVDIDIEPQQPAPLEAPSGDGLVTTKTIIDQSKTPMPANDTPTNWVHYEIKIENTNDPLVDPDPIELIRVFDGLPPGFQYEGVTKLNGVPIKQPEVVNALDLDPAEIQLLFDEGQPSLGVPRAMLTWHILDEKKLDVQILPGEFVLLTFKAKIEGSGLTPAGNYCNYAWTEPEGIVSGIGSRSGSVAKLVVGMPLTTECTGALVHVTSTATAVLNPNELPLDPNDDVLITYTIIVDNGGAVDLNLWWLRVKLPIGFNYLINTVSGSVTSSEPDHNDTIFGGRTVMGWFFLPTRAIVPAGGQSSVTFQAVAPRAAGLYRNEVWAFFDEYTDDDAPYSWPSAAVYLADVFNMKLNGKLVSQIWIVDGKAVVHHLDY